jgi:hypothetical protein
LRDGQLTRASFTGGFAGGQRVAGEADEASLLQQGVESDGVVEDSSGDEQEGGGAGKQQHVSESSKGASGRVII